MAYVGIADKWQNRDKREAELVVVTLDSLFKEGKGNREADEYITSWDGYSADVIEPDTIIQRAYCIIDEQFPSGAELGVDIGGTAFFAHAPGLDGSNMLISAVEDVLFKNAQTVTITVELPGAPQPVTQGKLRIVLEVLHPSIGNGNYAVG